LWFYSKMKKSALFLFSLVVLLFIFTKESFAATIFFDTAPPTGPNYSEVSASFCGVAADCANTYTTSTGNSACGLNGCGDGLNWTKYHLTCLYNSEEQNYEGYYEQLGERVYSIGDKCISGETGLRPGYCGGGYGEMYKRCCSGSTPVACTQASSILQDGIYPDEGACPSGSTETAPGVTSCPIAPPPPANYCEQAGYVACNPGSATGGSCINSSGQTCTAYSVYACNFNGQNYCYPNNTTCAAPCSAPPPSTASCNVTWNISNQTPPPNSTVNVSVTGSATPNWNGASYSLDNGSWINAGSGPAFNFNVNSGSTGTHSLRFSINNGSTVCGSQNSQTFVTQALNDASTCTAISVNNGNPVYAGVNYPATVSIRNAGTSTWTWNLPNPYKLGSQDPQDNNIWGLNRVDLPTSPIPPGSSAFFNFNVRSPATAGTYSFNWQMLREGIQWFGSRCLYNVNVQPATVTFTPSCTGTLINTQTRQVRWDAFVNPASPSSGSYTYSWSGDDGLSGSTQTVNKTYSTGGPKNAQVSVTSQGLTRSASCSVTIGVCNPGDRRLKPNACIEAIQNSRTCQL